MKLDLVKLKETIVDSDAGRWPWSVVVKLIDYTMCLDSLAVSAAAAAREAGHNTLADEVLDHVNRGVVL